METLTTKATKVTKETPLCSFVTLGGKKRNYMTNDTKQKVREFYDEIGWQQEDDGLYQNSRYEDLRPVSRE